MDKELQQNQSANQTAEAKIEATPIAKAAPKMNRMPEMIEAPVLGNYLDYRKYLADYYQYRRDLSAKDIRPYNYAVFSAGANIKSPNYLKMIIDGRRNLSDDMIGKFGKALGLNKEQTEEFRLLVNFTQSADPAMRNIALKDLNEFRVNSKLKSGEIDQKTWDKVPNWIAWILYSMIDQHGVDFTPANLRALLRGKASFDDIEAAINTLINAGEVKRDEATGILEKSRNLIDSPEEIPVALVRKLQTQLMYLGLESLFQDGPTEREFGSLTVSLTKPEFEDLKFQLRKFRKETQKNNSVKRMSSKGERVYQLNLQLFPVTDVSTDSSK